MVARTLLVLRYTYVACLVSTKFRYTFLISCMLLVLYFTLTSLIDIFPLSFLISCQVSAVDRCPQNFCTKCSDYDLTALKIYFAP